MSSNSCLKKIHKQVVHAGYTVSDVRVRQSCLQNNFNVDNAANKLIKEELFKITLRDTCIKMGYHDIEKIIICACDRFKFKSLQVEKYVLKLLKAKDLVSTQCIQANILISDEDLCDKIIASFGNASDAFMSIQLDL
jgi:hypothetical protein